MSNIVALAKMSMDVKLVIGDAIYDCAAVNINFSSNAIPQAQAILAVGVCVLGGSAPNIKPGDPAKIQTTAPTILHMQKAEIWFKPIGDWRPGGPSWPTGWTRIFWGYLTGFGAQKLRGSMRVTVNIVHWLADMAFSSSLSGQTHPSSAFQFSAWAPYATDSPECSGNEDATLRTLQGQSVNLAQHTGYNLFTPDKIQTDFWGNCLWPMFCNIASNTAFQFTPGNSCFYKEGQQNTRALNALRLMKATPGDYGPPSNWYMPLTLKIAEGGLALANAIGDAIANERLDSSFRTTMWDKLIYYGSYYGFSVIPRVETAVICPFIAGLSTTYLKAIRAVEMSYLSIDAVLAKPLRGVQVLSGWNARTFIFDPTGPPTYNVMGAGGCYGPEGVADDGLVLVKQAPGWMAYAGISSHDPANTAFGGTDQRPQPTATTPDAAGIRGGIDNKTSADTLLAVLPLYDRLAHFYYMSECLRGRFGVCYGKLRFDIAPGSTIAVENTQELHLQQDDALGSTNYVADVTRVSHEIDAEGSRAGTGFQLSHVRTSTENEAGVLSVAGHTIYDNIAWPGCPLIDSYLFPHDSAD